MRAIRANQAFDGERFLDGGATVVVQDTKIVGVEPATYALPDDVEVTTYDGTVLPGLVDAHVHLVSSGTRAPEPGSLEVAGGADDDTLDELITANLRTQALAGVTTVRDLGDTRYRTLLHRDAQRTGLPRILAAGPPVTMPGGHCHYLGGEAVGEAALRRAVAERVERGVDVLKVMASGGMLTPGTDVTAPQYADDDLRLLVEVAHEAGLRVLAHTHALSAAVQAVAAGVDGLEHFTCLTWDGPQTPDELLEQIAERGIEVDPTLGFDLAQMPPPDQMPPQFRELIDRLGLDPLAFMETRAEQMARVRQHGVRVVSGLDAGAAPPKRHGTLHLAIADLLRADWPMAEALATATSIGADACGLGGVTGRLAAGYDADVLVVDGDLAADPSALTRPLAVLVRGEPPAAP